MDNIRQSTLSSKIKVKLKAEKLRHKKRQQKQQLLQKVSSKYQETKLRKCMIQSLMTSKQPHKNSGTYFMIDTMGLTKFKPGNVQDFYQIDEKVIGRGAYGVIFRAKEKETSSNSWRALKAIPKKMIRNVETLMNELQNLSILDHPNIIRMYQIYENPASVFIVTDLCEGGELLQRVSEQRMLTEMDAKQIFIQIIETIHYCNANKISHRDLKLQNFMFLKKNSNILKLIDFGLSYKWQKSMRDELIEKGLNKVVGTVKYFHMQPFYIAPEIIKGVYDQRCDLWSAGVILYILFSGFPPFYGETFEQIFEEIHKGKVKLDIPEFKNLTPQCKDLINRLLQPQNERIKISQIFKHPWIKLKIPRISFQINYQRMRNFRSFSKLKKITAAYISHRLSQKEVEGLLMAFKQADKDHDGYISITEFKMALQHQKENKPINELKEIFSSISPNPYNKMSYSQFLTLNLQEKYLMRRSNLQKVFNILDTNKDGKVDKQELSTILKRNKFFNFDIKGCEINEIMSKCDKNKDGIIDFWEFVEYVAEK